MDYPFFRRNLKQSRDGDNGGVGAVLEKGRAASDGGAVRGRKEGSVMEEQ